MKKIKFIVSTSPKLYTSKPISPTSELFIPKRFKRSLGGGLRPVGVQVLTKFKHQSTVEIGIKLIVPITRYLIGLMVHCLKKKGNKVIKFIVNFQIQTEFRCWRFQEEEEEN
ncbi:hypothetical protein ACTFIW_002788 [Dictyostelium discoideum]